MNRKYKHINILKALGIIAVVLGHAGSPITSIIYLYHMSLFFFISGYLYNESHEKNFTKFFIRKVKSLYIPFILVELIFVLLRNFFINLNIYSASQVAPLTNINDWIVCLKQIITFNYTGDAMLGAIWFLKALFYVNILYFIFNITFKKIFKNNNEYIKFIIVVFMAIVGFYAIGKGYNPIVYLNPNNNKVLGVFLGLFDARNFLLLAVYYMGGLYRRKEEKIPLNIYITLACLTILYFSSKLGNIDVSTYRFVNPIFFLVTSMLGIYINLYIAKKLSNFNIPLLEYIGEGSLFIMLLHFLAFKIVNVYVVIAYNMTLENIAGYPVTQYGGYWWIIYTLVGVSVPLIFRYGYYALKNKVLKKPLKN